jgi:hypothetical protein
LLFVGSFFTPFYGEICAKNEYTNQKDCSTYHLALVFIWQVAKILNDAASALTAIATALLAVITWFLVRFAKEQSATTRAELRAYVLIGGGRIADIGDRGGRIVEIQIRNFGQTPAHDVQFWVGAGIRQFPLNSKLGPPSDPIAMSADVMAPNQTSTMFVPVPVSTDPQEEWLRKGKAAIYAFGQVTYKDAFGVGHYTDFRHMCYGEGFPKGLMSPCQEGNKYT